MASNYSLHSTIGQTNTTNRAAFTVCNVEFVRQNIYSETGRLGKSSLKKSFKSSLQNDITLSEDVTEPS